MLMTLTPEVQDVGFEKSLQQKNSFRFSTGCVTDLDWGSEMIVFE